MVSIDESSVHNGKVAEHVKWEREHRGKRTGNTCCVCEPEARDAETSDECIASVSILIVKENNVSKT